MRTVDRHAFNSTATELFFQRGADRLKRLLARDEPPKMMQLHRIGQSGLEMMQEASVFDPQHVLLRTAARTLAQASWGAMLHAVTPRGAAVEFPLGDKRFTMESVGPNGDSDVGAWKQGWEGALMAREAAVLQGLRTVPDEPLDAGARFDTYHYCWKRALIALDSNPQLAIEEATKAIQLTDDRFISEAKPGVPAVGAATFPMLIAIARDDASAFNEALVKALEAHRDFWGAEAPHGPISWFAPTPQALCCLAQDRGIAIEVESGYLLPELYRRD